MAFSQWLLGYPSLFAEALMLDSWSQAAYAEWIDVIGINFDTLCFEWVDKLTISFQMNDVLKENEKKKWKQKLCETFVFFISHTQDF